MNFSWAFIFDTTGYVVKALPLTLFLTIFPVTAGLVLGFLLALLKMYRVPVANRLVSIYVSFFRSIPLLVLLFLAFYGIPKLINFTFYGGERVWGSIDMNKNVTAVVTLTLYSSAFLCEIVRGALNSVDMRQMEAAHALGMTKRQAYFRIIIPQAIKNILPALGNEFITLFKDTALVTTIGGKELLYAAQAVGARTYSVLFPYLGIAVIYLVMVILFTWLLGIFERRLRASDRR